MNIPVSVQLYTVRDDMTNGFEGTLEKIAQIGYKWVEFAGYFGNTSSQVKACLDRLGLKVSGSHTGMDLLTDKLDETIEFNLEIGSPYIIFPWKEYNGLEDYLDSAGLFNRIGEKCYGKGLGFCYHNHDFEFDVFNGEHALDIIYNNTDPRFVKAQIDTFWVKYAGIDPVGFIKKYSGRCPTIHIKDMEANEARDFTEIGNGTMDIPAIAAAAKENGAEYLVVEQDSCKRPPLESIKISFENLKKMNLV